MKTLDLSLPSFSFTWPHLIDLRSIQTSHEPKTRNNNLPVTSHVVFTGRHIQEMQSYFGARDLLRDTS